jgi:O-antigen/teichoic acid export membrane protein
MLNKSAIKKESLKKNFFFQTIYQIVSLLIPMFVSPYLTRTLGQGALGEYTFSNSISYYFIILAALGISSYGQRLISTKKDSPDLLRKSFWSLYFVHAILSIISIVSYVIFVFFYKIDYKYIFYLQIIYVMSSFFDVTWLFYGLENFQLVVFANFLVKIIECISIFVFIHSSNDLWIYTLIMSLSTLFSQAILLPKAIRLVKPIKFGWSDIKIHIKPLLVLSIACIASTLYTVFDKTLLGIMTNTDDVAFYEYSNKIINIPKSIMGAITIIFYPRACSCLEKKDYQSAKKYINFSLNYVGFLGFATIFGLLGIGNLFTILYYGSDFAVCGNYVILLSVLPLIIMIGDVSRNQYLIPMKKDKSYTISICLSAIINLVLSACLIPYIGVYGAIVGTICAELFGSIFQMICSKALIPIKTTILTMLPYAICGVVMYGSILLIRSFKNSSWLDLCCQFLLGGIVYCVLSFLYIWFLSPIKNNVRTWIKNVLHKK